MLEPTNYPVGRGKPTNCWRSLRYSASLFENRRMHPRGRSPEGRIFYCAAWL